MLSKLLPDLCTVSSISSFESRGVDVRCIILTAAIRDDFEIRPKKKALPWGIS